MLREELMERTVEAVLSLMETEGAHWTKPWGSCPAPMNAHTREFYRGMNNINLTLCSWSMGVSNLWLTYKQAQMLGGTVRRGEKAFAWIAMPMPFVVGEGDDEKTITRWKPKAVFNVDQCDIEPGLIPQFEAGEGAETDEAIARWIDAVGVDVRHAGDAAFYDPRLDFVNMPPLHSWLGDPETATAAYHSVLFHELTHATGHPSRLKRFSPELGIRFGDEAYAFEELIAELGAAMLCQLRGVSKEPRLDHAQYLNGWMKKIRDKPASLLHAITAAKKAVTWLEDRAVLRREKAA